MPPALSDYEFDDSDEELVDFGPIEAGQNSLAATATPSQKSSAEVSSRKPSNGKVKAKNNSATVPKRAASQGRKQSSLLAGLDLENIITVSDSDGEEASTTQATPPTSSIPTSSYRTRGRLHGTQKSELCYDQKYHPMDDYIQPKQAAKMRAKYGDDLLASDDTNITMFNEVDDTEAETDVEDDLSNKAQGRKRPLPISPQATRRSSRSVNRDVIYNMKIHPQDDEIKELEEADEAEGSPRKRVRLSVETDHNDYEEQSEEEIEDVHNDDVVEGDEEVYEDEDDKEIEEATEDGHADNALMHSISIKDTDDDEVSCSSSGRSAASPHCNEEQVSSSGVQHGGQNGYLRHSGRDHSAHDADAYPTGTGQSFDIHVESLDLQRAAEAAAPPSHHYDDNDKENDVANPELEQSPDPNEGMTVRSVAVLQERTQVYDPECEDDFTHFTQAGDYRSDGADVDSVLGRFSSGRIGSDGVDEQHSHRPAESESETNVVQSMVAE